MHIHIHTRYAAGVPRAVPKGGPKIAAAPVARTRAAAPPRLCFFLLACLRRPGKGGAAKGERTAGVV